MQPSIQPAQPGGLFSIPHRRRDSADRCRRLSCGRARRGRRPRRRACATPSENVGFYYLAGRRAAQADRRHLCSGRALPCAQPLEAKLAIKVDEHNIGYMPIAERGAAQCRRAGQEAQPEQAYFLRRERDARRSRRDLRPPLPCRRTSGRPTCRSFRETTPRIHRDPGEPLPEAGEALCAGRARPAGDLLRRLLCQAAHDPAHVALPADRRQRRECRKPRATHRLGLHDAPAAQQGAGSFPSCCPTAAGWMRRASRMPMS